MLDIPMRKDKSPAKQTNQPANYHNAIGSTMDSHVQQSEIEPPHRKNEPGIRKWLNPSQVTMFAEFIQTVNLHR